MGAGTVPNSTFDRVGAVLIRALNGLSIEQLRSQPAGPESNPIGWISFHLSRVHDNTFSSLLGKEQAWKEEKWYEKFGLSPQTTSLGGSSLDQVRAFDPVGAEVLAGYWRATRARSHEFLESISDSDIEKLSPSSPPSAPEPETIRLTIARVTSDAAQHIGQVAYIRGLVGKHGWYGA
jgi:hypothetical protein